MQPHPLGPLIYSRRSRRRRRARLLGVAVLTICGAALTAAARLSPDPSGLGSHRQLGYPDCWAISATGYPCPTCGMTTAFALTVRGKWPAAILAQPGGWLLAVGAIALAGLSAVTVLTGRVWTINWYRLPPFRLAKCGVGVLLAAWAFKIAVGVLTGTLPVIAG